MPQQTLDVTGMSCTGCEANVEDALAEIDGVTSVSADHDADTVAVTSQDSVDEATIHAAIEEAGYETAA